MCGAAHLLDASAHSGLVLCSCSWSTLLIYNLFVSALCICRWANQQINESMIYWYRTIVSIYKIHPIAASWTPLTFCAPLLSPAHTLPVHFQLVKTQNTCCICNGESESNTILQIRPHSFVRCVDIVSIMRTWFKRIHANCVQYVYCWWRWMCIWESIFSSALKCVGAWLLFVLRIRNQIDFTISMTTHKHTHAHTAAEIVYCVFAANAPLYDE